MLRRKMRPLVSVAGQRLTPCVLGGEEEARSDRCGAVHCILF